MNIQLFSHISYRFFLPFQNSFVIYLITVLSTEPSEMAFLMVLNEQARLPRIIMRLNYGTDFPVYEAVCENDHSGDLSDRDSVL